jgi:hypothetical protein
MAFNARVYRILIASPSDVVEERNQISKVIQEWNDLQSFDRKVVLLPLKWETHSSPELGKRPQDIINEEVVDYCDMAVGVFWTRIGSPTRTHKSGTIEEIERVGKSGKIVMLYFSKVKIEPDSIDLEQYQNLKDFKKKTYPNGLIENYTDIVDFRDKFAKQLEIKLRSIIGSDNDVDSSLSNVSEPKFEISLVDDDIDVIIQNKSTITIEVNELENLDSVPDYIKSDKKDYKDDDYYRNIITNYINEENAKSFYFNLHNVGQISIRDIFCEVKIEKNKNFIIGTRHFRSQNRLNRLSRARIFSLRSRLNYENHLPVVENDNEYVLNFKYDALQPQRNITIPNNLVYLNNGLKTLEIEITTYADCFSSPLVSKLEFKIIRKVNKIDALEFAKEIRLIE